MFHKTVLNTIMTVYSKNERKEIKSYLAKSYQKNSKIKDGNLDKHLSGKRVKVFHNNDTGKTVVVHRGTASTTDWIKTNLPMAFGYEKGERFKHAKRIQKKAEKKYGRENTTTMGHSLGGRLAEKVGTKSKEIITYNKAATPLSVSHKRRSKQNDIRTSRDPVSYLSKFQKGKNKTQIIKSKSYNLLNEHAVDKLK